MRNKTVFTNDQGEPFILNVDTRCMKDLLPAVAQKLQECGIRVSPSEMTSVYWEMLHLGKVTPGVRAGARRIDITHAPRVREIAGRTLEFVQDLKIEIFDQTQEAVSMGGDLVPLRVVATVSQPDAGQPDMNFFAKLAEEGVTKAGEEAKKKLIEVGILKESEKRAETSQAAA